MLFINNPDTYRAIVDERRRDDGQFATEQAEVSRPTRRPAPTTRWAWNRYRPRPVPTA